MNRGGKRKRGDAYESHDGNDRPSPHRPENLDTGRRANHPSGPENGSPRSQTNQGSRGGRRNAKGGPNRSSRSAGPSSPLTADAQAQAESLENRITTQNQRDAIKQSALSAAEPPSQLPEHTTAANPSNTNGHTAPAVALASAAQSLKMTEISIPKSTRPSSAFVYRTVTDEIAKDWQGLGSARIQAAASGSTSDNHEVATASLFLEIIRSGLDQRITISEAGEAVRLVIDAVTPDAQTDISELFLDVISTLPEEDATHPLLKPLMFSTEIDAQLMRQVLEEPMLQSLGLVRSTFQKIFVRKQTHVLYRQANYNLLREETEGYSKLITELFTVSQNERMPERIVEATHQNVKALIGAFDLDAGRVLDVTLDLFATMLIKNGRFFVKFLRQSSYWPQEPTSSGITASDPQIFGALPLWAQPGQPGFTTSEEDKESISRFRAERDAQFWNQARKTGLEAYFGLGQRVVLDKGQIAEQIRQAEESLSGNDNSTSVRNLETKKWIEQTSTLPPEGNPVAAQLLGFKLRFYQSSARDKEDVLPLNMVYLTALLIKIGFISLRDLYPHLYPSDEDMAVVRERQMMKKEERERLNRPGGSAMNALAKAGALTDDTLLVSTTTTSRLRAPEGRSGTPSKSHADGGGSTPGKVEGGEGHLEPLPEPAEQKVPLLKALLLIGALPESLYVLGKFPWLLDAFPELPSHINRLLHHSLAFMYEQVSPVSSDKSLQQTTQVIAADQGGVARGEVRLVDQTPPKKKRWAQAENAEYSFYWEDWADNVPVCRSVDDVFTLCDTLVNILGARLGQDPALLMKLARIGKQSLATDTSAANQDRWKELLKRTLCPSLSLLPHANPGVVNEVFDMLKTYPPQIRYNIYEEWFTGQTSRVTEVAESFAYTRAETKDVLRRINKTNTREMARNLAKASCASPGIVFEVCLKQIESYDNLIDVVVECGRYFTYLAYDVLTWSIMSCLGREGRSRVSQTGFTANKWLQAQSTFVGRIYKRFNSMNALPMLQYVFDQIRQNNSTDLRILRDLISNMSGVVADTSFTDAQVLAMSGGKHLQSLTLRSMGDKRHESKATAKRLIRTLVDNDLAGPMLVSIAQHRQRCIFEHEQDENKILGETYDEVTMVLMQYLDMLSSHYVAEEFEGLVPDVISLVSEYAIEPGMAFTIHRKAITSALASYDAEHKSKKRALSTANETKRLAEDVEMKDLADPSAAPSQGHTSEQETGADLKSNEAGRPSSDKKAPSDEQNEECVIVEDTSPWHPVLEDLAIRLRPALPADYEEGLSIHFLVTFWQLDLSDIVAPSMSYDQEFHRQTAKITALLADKTDVTPAAVRRKKQAEQEVQKTKDELTSEMRGHIRDYQVVRNRLVKEKDHWFGHRGPQSKKLTQAIFQQCFLPRILLSPLDSQFAQRMLFFIHSVGAPGFSTLELLGKIFAQRTLTNLIFQCTSREADSLGRFLYEVLKVLAEWHANRSVFEKKAHGPKKDLPGFALKFDAQGSPKVFQDYEAFRNILFVWHRNLWHALVDSFDSYEFMHVRNAITVLSRVSKVYPSVDWMGEKILKALDRLEKRESYDKNNLAATPLARPDLFHAAISVKAGVLKRKSDWILTQAFSVSKAAPKPQTIKVDPAPSKTAPQNNSEAPGSTTAAKAVAPISVTASNVEPPLSTARSEMEEGEFREVIITETPVPAQTHPEQRNEAISSSKPNAAFSVHEPVSQPTGSADPAPTHSVQSTQYENASKTQRSDDDKVEPIQAQELPRSQKQTETPGPSSRFQSVLSVNEARVEDTSRQPSAPPYPTRNQTLEQAPNGPRNPRQRSIRSNGDVSRNHENMGPPPLPRASLDRPIDLTHPEPARGPRHQDISYGRLNAEPDPYHSPPSKMANRETRSSNVVAPPQERQYVTGSRNQPLATDRARERPQMSADPSDRNFAQHPQRVPPISPSPVAEVPTSPDGIHPSRLRRISVESVPRPAHQAAQPPLSPAQHRPAYSPQAYSPAPHSMPSGPRSNYALAPDHGSSNAAARPSMPQAQHPPSGPSTNGNMSRGDGHRQFAGINDTLRQGGQAPSINSSSSAQRSGIYPNPGQLRSVSGPNERSGHPQEFRPAPQQPMESARFDRPVSGQPPASSDVMPPRVVNNSNTVSVDPGRAALIAQNIAPPQIQRQQYQREDHRNTRPQAQAHVNQPQPNAVMPALGSSGPGTSIRGRASMPDIQNRPNIPPSILPPINGTVPPRPPIPNGNVPYDRRDQANIPPVPRRNVRTDAPPPRDDDRQRRDDRNRPRDGREFQEPQYQAESSRHHDTGRDLDRDVRIDSERDQMIWQREKEMQSRDSRPHSRDTARRDDERERNTRPRELMPGAVQDYRERERSSGGRSRDERSGNERDDLMGPRHGQGRGAPSQRLAVPRTDYGSTAHNSRDRREDIPVDSRGDGRGGARGSTRISSGREDGRHDGRGDVRRGDYEHERISTGESGRPKREWNGDEGSRDNKRPRRGGR